MIFKNSYFGPSTELGQKCACTYLYLYNFAQVPKIAQKLYNFKLHNLQIVIFLPLNHTPTIKTTKNKAPTDAIQAKHQTVWGKADKVRLAALIIDGRPAC